MKIKCDFCHTEYNVAIPRGPVRCVVCGNVWTPAVVRRRGAWIVVITALMALFAAMIFATATIIRSRATDIATHPLVAVVTSAAAVDTDTGRNLVVRGTVHNRSAQIYGVPDLILTAYDENGDIISQQRFMPSASLLDVDGVAEFEHTMSISPDGVRRVGASLAETGELK